jgi:hypothetical protein
MKGKTAWIVAVSLVIGPLPTAAQSSKPDLRQIASRLDLTASGARRWLDALGVRADRPPLERLLAVSGTGEIVVARDGGESSVSLGLDLDTRLLHTGEVLVLVHNHPGNAGLSAGDLVQLAKAGVAAVVAVAHDGSIYMAARGARYHPDRFEDGQYDVVRLEIRKRLRVECGSGAIRVADGDAQFSHLTAMALAEAGVIEYRAVLSSKSRASFEAARVPFGHVVVAAASKVPFPLSP